MHSRHGELLPNGFHVGDLVSYNSDGSTRYGVILPSPARAATFPTEVRGYPATHWCMWRDTEAEAFDAYARHNPERFGETYTTNIPTLVRSHDDMETSTERSNTMSVTFYGETLTADMQPEDGVIAGQEYRVIYPQEYHNFEFIGRARDTRASRRSVTFEIVRWVRENNGYDSNRYPAGYEFSSTPASRTSTAPSCLHLPYTGEPEAPATTQEAAYDGTLGAFEPHNGQMPESGTIVRGFSVVNSLRQLEGLFLRLDGGEATVERKRKRMRKSDGTFTEWEMYNTAGRVGVTVEGAEVFKPGGTTIAKPTWNRLRAIDSSRTGRRAELGQIVSGQIGDTSGPDRGLRAENYFRGEVINVGSYGGPYMIRATEVCDLSETAGRSTSDRYNWRTLDEPRDVQIYAVFSDGSDTLARAAWVWEKLEPGAKRVDPAFDPKRATTYTGMKIGDLVVGLQASGGRDTVSSWVRGEFIKWDTRRNMPIVKVTDPMESTAKVGAEVTVSGDDTYPALADPKTSDPERFKTVLRAYLIGRHKRGDMCRGGLNTMLAAFGIPLYETRRIAKLSVSVEYDPNTTDLYGLQSSLRRGMTGVAGLAISEAEGHDFEVMQDQTGN